METKVIELEEQQAIDLLCEKMGNGNLANEFFLYGNGINTTEVLNKFLEREFGGLYVMKGMAPKKYDRTAFRYLEEDIKVWTNNMRVAKIKMEIAENKVKTLETFVKNAHEENACYEEIAFLMARLDKAKLERRALLENYMWTLTELDSFRKRLFLLKELFINGRKYWRF